MLRLVVSNQRGGVAKTTTATTLARLLADRGRKVLIVDTDPQGSILSVLPIKPERFLYDMLVGGLALKECITPACEGIDVLASNRRTNQAEQVLMGQTGREFAFENVLTQMDGEYDAVLVDCAPSIDLFQTCAMIYTRNVLIPVSMEALSVQGAYAAASSVSGLNKVFKLPSPIRVAGILPVMVNRRLAMTEVVSRSLEELSRTYRIPLLSPIRTDQTVVKAAKSRQFLADFDPRAKALEDYANALNELLGTLEEPDVQATDNRAQTQTT